MRNPAARRMRNLYLLGAFLLTGSFGCWEQWSESWFPQMKWQKSVQAFERTMHDGKVDLFMPPEGTVPVGAPGSPPMDPLDEVAQSALQNPRAATLESLENGRLQYERYCAVCHGENGKGDGPVSMMGDIKGPFVGVLAVNGPGNLSLARSDGHVYSTIRYGRRRMPSYQRIPEDGRWDIVNYIRYMNGRMEVAR
jgi:mono/diheme cytochrome c family protein